MITKTVSNLMAAWVMLACLSGAAARAETPTTKPASGSKVVQPPQLTDQEFARLGLFVKSQLDAGLRGQALATAIHERQAQLKAEHDAAKAKKESEQAAKDSTDGTKTGGDTKGPGEALKHGLNDADLTGLGKFVNEKLADGLRGKDLADAIQGEAKQRETQRAEAMKGAGGPDGDHGNSAGSGQGGGNGESKGAGHGNAGNGGKGGKPGGGGGDKGGHH